MSRWSGAVRQIRARTLPQQLIVLLVVAIEVFGIIAIFLGHRDLGRTLIGLGIVAIFPVFLWMRTTELRTKSRTQ